MKKQRKRKKVKNKGVQKLSLPTHKKEKDTLVQQSLETCIGVDNTPVRTRRRSPLRYFRALTIAAVLTGFGLYTPPARSNTYFAAHNQLVEDNELLNWFSGKSAGEQARIIDSAEGEIDKLSGVDELYATISKCTDVEEMSPQQLEILIQHNGLAAKAVSNIYQWQENSLGYYFNDLDIILVHPLSSKERFEKTILLRNETKKMVLTHEKIHSIQARGDPQFIVTQMSKDPRYFVITKNDVSYTGAATHKIKTDFSLKSKQEVEELIISHFSRMSEFQNMMHEIQAYQTNPTLSDEELTICPALYTTYEFDNSKLVPYGNDILALYGYYLRQTGADTVDVQVAKCIGKLSENQDLFDVMIEKNIGSTYDVDIERGVKFLEARGKRIKDAYDTVIQRLVDRARREK
jgi:hypothetical protein